VEKRQAQNLSHTKKKTKTKAKDPCPICEKELYHNKYYSKRVGLFDTNTTDHDVIGWMCPRCNSEFDNSDNIMYIYGENSIQGDS
jgi:hypothetical protein